MFCKAPYHMSFDLALPWAVIDIKNEQGKYKCHYKQMIAEKLDSLKTYINEMGLIFQIIQRNAITHVIS